MKTLMQEEGIKRRRVMYVLRDMVKRGLIYQPRKGVYQKTDERSVSRSALSQNVGEEVGKCHPTLHAAKQSTAKSLRIYNLAILGYAQPTIETTLKIPQSTISYHIKKMVREGALIHIKDTDPKQYKKGKKHEAWDKALVNLWNMERPSEKSALPSEVHKKVGETEGILPPTEGDVVVVDWLPSTTVEAQGLMFEMVVKEAFTLPEDVEQWGNEQVGRGFKLDVGIPGYPFRRRAYFVELNVEHGGGWKAWFHLPPFPVDKAKIREGISEMERVGNTVGVALCKRLGLRQMVLVEPVKDKDGNWKRNIQIAFSFPEGLFNDKLHSSDWGWWTDDTPTVGTWETNDLTLAEIMGDMPNKVKGNMLAVNMHGKMMGEQRMVLLGLERRACFFDSRLDKFFTELVRLKDDVARRFGQIEQVQSVLVDQQAETNRLLKEIVAKLPGPKDHIGDNKKNGEENCGGMFQ